MCGVTPLDSHLSCPILCGRITRYARGSGSFFLERILESAMATQAFAVKAGGPAQSHEGCEATKTVDRNPRHDPETPACGLSTIMHPTRPSYPTQLREPFSARSRFGAPSKSSNRGQKIPRPLPPSADGLAVLKTLLGAAGGKAKHVSAEQGKARTSPLRTSRTSTTF